MPWCSVENLSTSGPQMGISERLTQIGQMKRSYQHPYTQFGSTVGEKLGMMTPEGLRVVYVTGVKETSHRPRLGLDAAREVGDLVEQRASFRHQLTDLAVRVHHCGVIATTERLANLG